jgi:hypothetical protein
VFETPQTAQNAQRDRRGVSGVALRRRSIAATSNFDTSKPPILATRLPGSFMLSPVYFQTHYLKFPSGYKVGTRRQLDTSSTRAHTQTHTRVRREGTQPHSGLMSLEEQIEGFEKMDAQIKVQQAKMEVCFHTVTHSHTRANARHTHTHTWWLHTHTHMQSAHTNTRQRHAHTSP